MEIRNNTEALKAFLGVPSASSTEVQQTRGTEKLAAQAAFAGDQATLSAAGTEASQSAAESEVRTDKVTAIQQALAAGTYSVPASAVAGKVVDTMLADGIVPGK